MKKDKSLILLVIFLIFLSAKIAFAFSLGSLFGGRIILTPATKIFTLQASNYSCKAGLAGGSSISIAPLGSNVGTPTNYYIPILTRSVTGTIPTIGQLILGMYGPVFRVACVFKGNPPTVVTVPLNTIIYFGTSKR